MSICSLLGGLAGLLILGWLALGFLSWPTEREARRRHKLALRACSTEEISSRAWNWGYLECYAETPAVKEFRALLEQQRYEEMLRRWRRLSSALLAVGDEPSPAKPEFIDSGSDQALRDYVEVLLERQRRGE
ncbi:hypothetical protein [Archangium sp.]|uniref:hypothetical protein n=1 Tax=Archangium sp. TaxID=1872627 RepID=UPI00286A892C|nr:hypothetical protein [Archangium sp.]